MTAQPSSSSASSSSAALTRRQEQVLRAVATGQTFKTVGDDLGISEQTVKNHMTNIRQRLGADSVMDALIRKGWLVVPK